MPVTVCHQYVPTTSESLSITQENLLTSHNVHSVMAKHDDITNRSICNTINSLKVVIYTRLLQQQICNMEPKQLTV